MSIKQKQTVALGWIMYLLFVAPAAAEEAPYMSAHTGVSWLSDADVDDNSVSAEIIFDRGFLAGISVGYDFGILRVEGEMGYRSNDITEIQDIKISGTEIGDYDDSGNVTSLSFLVNGFYDFDAGGICTPYIGGGVGFAIIDIDDITIDGLTVGDTDDAVIAYQLGGGLGFAVTDKVTLDVGYRFFGTPSPDFDKVSSAYNNHNLTLALRYIFH